MSKGDQPIEAVGGHIVDVVGIQTSRRKRNRENWLQEKNSGLLTQWISEVITKNTTAKDGHELPYPFFILRIFYISILFATSPLRPDILFTSLLVSWLSTDSSPLEPPPHSCWSSLSRAPLQTRYEFVSFPNYLKVWNKKVQETQAEILFQDL